MAVEFTTTDKDAVAKIAALYASARDFPYGTWAIFAQVLMETTSVRVKAVLIPPYWAKQIQNVLARMQLSEVRRKAKPRSGRSDEA